MIHLKTTKDLQIMKEGGEILKSVLDFLLSEAKEGISLIKLDQMAESMIRSKGAESSFKEVC